MEKWKQINDFDYYVSNSGRIKNKHGRILKPSIRNGYYSIDLMKNKKRYKYYIHRLVAKAFIQNPEEYPMVNHKDENKLNDKVENLEWCDNTYNSQYPNDLSVYCLDLDKYFKSSTEASVHTGVCRTSIIKACRGYLELAGGMLWCYAKDKDTKFPH